MKRRLMSANEYGASLNPPISGRRVRMLCKTGKISDCYKMTGDTGQWIIWSDAVCKRRPYARREND